MINGFIIVSVLCLKGIAQNSHVAGMNPEKVMCTADIGKVYKTQKDCENEVDKNKETLEVDRGASVKKIVILPGQACVEINKIVSEEVTWKLPRGE